MKKVKLFIVLSQLSFHFFSQMDSLKAIEETKRKMVLAKENADNYLIRFFGEQIFNTNIKWDIYHSRVSARYNHVLTNYLDTVSFIPQEYKLNYKIYDDRTLVDYFYLEADSLGFVEKLPTNHYLYDDLIGYKGTSKNSVWNDKAVIFFRYKALKTEFSLAK
jgi:hypothetical protein